MGVQALFGLQGCHRVTQTRYQKRWQECPPQGTPATHLKKQWLLWGPSALSVEPITVSFRRPSPGSPWKGLLGTPFSRPPGNRCLQWDRNKARRKETANPGSSRRLPTKGLWYYRETRFVCFFPCIAVKVPLALFMSIEIVFPSISSMEHCKMPVLSPPKMSGEWFWSVFHYLT